MQKDCLKWQNLQLDELADNINRPGFNISLFSWSELFHLGASVTLQEIVIAPPVSKCGLKTLQKPLIEKRQRSSYGGIDRQHPWWPTVYALPGVNGETWADKDPYSLIVVHFIHLMLCQFKSQTSATPDLSQSRWQMDTIPWYRLTWGLNKSSYSKAQLCKLKSHVQNCSFPLSFFSPLHFLWLASPTSCADLSPGISPCFLKPFSLLFQLSG